MALCLWRNMHKKEKHPKTRVLFCRVGLAGIEPATRGL
jgi:hypothetical protein